MRINGFDFVHVCDIEPERDTDASVREFMPQDRYRNIRNLPLNRYGAGPFCKFKIPNRFLSSGVYLVVVGNELHYVGDCANLSARFNIGYGNISPKNYFRGGQETNCRLNNLIYGAAQNGLLISLWFFQTASYKSVEAALRAALKPKWNRA